MVKYNCLELLALLEWLLLEFYFENVFEISFVGHEDVELAFLFNKKMAHSIFRIADYKGSFRCR